MACSAQTGAVDAVPVPDQDASKNPLQIPIPNHDPKSAVFHLQKGYFYVSTRALDIFLLIKNNHFMIKLHIDFS